MMVVVLITEPINLSHMPNRKKNKPGYAFCMATQNAGVRMLVSRRVQPSTITHQRTPLEEGFRRKGFLNVN